jgi:hypothetical protein
LASGWAYELGVARVDLKVQEAARGGKGEGARGARANDVEKSAARSRELSLSEVKEGNLEPDSLPHVGSRHRIHRSAQGIGRPQLGTHRVGHLPVSLPQVVVTDVRQDNALELIEDFGRRAALHLEIESLRLEVVAPKLFRVLE